MAYSVVHPSFWTGKTGRNLRRRGRDVQLLGLYLMTSRHRSVSGVYPLPIAYAANETGLSEEEVRAGLGALEEEDFAVYDPETEWVWVCESARFQVGEELRPGDKRRVAMEREIRACESHDLRLAWLRRYGDPYGIDWRGRRPAESAHRPSVSVDGRDPESQGSGSLPSTETAEAVSAVNSLCDELGAKRPESGLIRRWLRELECPTDWYIAAWSALLRRGAWQERGRPYTRAALAGMWAQHARSNGDGDADASRIDADLVLTTLSESLPSDLCGRVLALRGRGDLESVERALGMIEREFFDQQYERYPPADRSDIDAELGEALLRLGSRLSAEYRGEVENRLRREAVRRRMGLPRLSLFVAPAQATEGIAS